ncbi:MAG: hypothetical protein DRO90_00530 [Candidatus Altiarchaeales archaeon]|nr:MAG: hypothetical protein DRO90_00530 [Candidatus Altiarchaeales archaeon]
MTFLDIALNIEVHYYNLEMYTYFNFLIFYKINMRILWCITGAGHFLTDTFKFMKNISEENEIIALFSNAGLEVVRMYGLYDEIENISINVIKERERGYSGDIIVGRLAMKEYDKVLIAPCTANTVAKIVYGIADSLVSNVAAQAIKCNVPVFVLPTDVEREQITEIPLNINSKKCRNCSKCIPMEVCPNYALYRSDKIRVNILKCNACLICIDKCKYNAISFGEKIKIRIRSIDLRNVEKLEGMEGIKVIRKVDDLISLLI